MGRKKQTNDVLAGNNNGGLHSARQLATLRKVMTTHDLKQAVLYQVILSGSTKTEYQATMKALVRHIRTKCRAEYIGGYEVGDEKGGIHAHAFVIIETAHHFPADLLDVSEGKFIARRIKRRKLSIRIEPPKNVMHGGQMFARMNTPTKLADCIKWASYYVKCRSKEDVTGRETYFGSEFASNIAKREGQRQKHRDALLKCSPPAPVTTQPTINDIEGEATMTDNSLTPAGHAYIARLYEGFVDKRYNVAQIKTGLSKAGIRRTVGQVEFDLTYRYGFTGYAERHPAPPVLTRTELHAIEEAKASKPARILRRSKTGSELVSSALPRKQSFRVDHKLLDSNYDLAHNGPTNFRATGATL